MQERELGALVIGRLDNLFWLGCGADMHVPLTGDAGVATFVVTDSDVRLLTSNIEAPRLLAEEVAGLGVEVEAVDWWQDAGARVAAAVRGAQGRVGSDLPAAERELVNLAPLRWSLVPDEVAAYRALGKDQGAAVAEVARGCERGDSETALAGALARALLGRGITPTVLLVAADERIAQFRHPLPTHRTVDRAVMLVAGGRRRGLIVSLTRVVHFGEPSDELLRRHAAVTAVDAAFINHTVVGARVGEIFAAGQAAYAEHGFAQEWQLHHQGGATGYAGRDYRGAPGSAEVVQPWQAFAWNPSIAGTKSEDTILATPDGAEVLSGSPDWPLREARCAGRSVARPEILVR